MTSSVAELEQEISEKKERFESVKNDIESAKENIKDLNLKIYQVKNDITNFVNANRLFAALKSAADIARTVTKPPPEKVELNDEHLEIIAKKRSELKPLKDKMLELAKTQEVLEHQLFDMRVDISEEKNEILDLKEQIREANDRANYTQAKNNSLREQLNEKVNEKRSHNETKREAEQALATLKDRAESSMSYAGGRLDLVKSIISLQDQYNNLKSDIADIESAIEEEKRAKRQAQEESERQKKELQEAVNWKIEKEELKKEYADLMEQINSQKKDVRGKEKKATKQIQQFERYAPLVKKWALKLGDIEEPEESVYALYDKLNKAKEDRKLASQQKHDEMAKLVVSNARLEKDVNRKRKALDRVVEQFHTDEAAMKKSIEEKKESFVQEEQKLLKQIDEAKIKLAQKYLSK